MERHDLVIAGGGIVGTATALWARMRGLGVVLIDPARPEDGTAAGSAGVFASYSCLPINDPSIFRRLPGLLGGGQSPLRAAPLHLVREMRWHLAFLANCTKRRSRAIAGDLAWLLARADSGIDPLIAEADAGDLVVARGQVSVWTGARGADMAAAEVAAEAAHGMAVEALDPARLREMEPGLALEATGASFHPRARHLSDPGAFIARLRTRFEAMGGEVLRATVRAVREEAGGVRVETDAGALLAGHAVIASRRPSG
ncbi:FAD-binding oxidoreductase, partial [Roseobacter sp. HKCCA0434]|uniref:NAD(P)/FAD-dependent oxidoreductase n=1 Tax=Roseobacter sp. HKCCA0434 TaxID=3079297 RepID=UPI0029058819